MVFCDKYQPDYYYTVISFTPFATGFISSLFTDKLFSRFWAIISGYATIASGYSVLIGVFYFANHQDYVIEFSFYTFSAIFLVTVGEGMVWGESLILGANRIREPRAVILFFHGYSLFYQIGNVLAYYFMQKTPNWDVKNVICCTFGCFILSFVSFLLGSRFHHSGYRRHIEDPFVLLFPLLYKKVQKLLPTKSDLLFSKFKRR